MRLAIILMLIAVLFGGLIVAVAPTNAAEGDARLDACACCTCDPCECEECQCCSCDSCECD